MTLAIKILLNIYSSYWTIHAVPRRTDHSLTPHLVAAFNCCFFFSRSGVFASMPGFPYQNFNCPYKFFQEKKIVESPFIQDTTALLRISKILSSINIWWTNWNIRMYSFDVLLTLHLSIFISVFNQLDAHNFCLTRSFISCLYMFRAHVLIIRRSKLHYTASGIIRPLDVMIPKAVMMSTCARNM